MKRLRLMVALAGASALLAGCGEMSNTLHPQAGTANTITVALDAPPNFSQAGIFEARAAGMFAQTDLRVRFIQPADPIRAIVEGSAQIAISNEPQILLARNRHVALAAVAAILQGPEHVLVHCSAPHASTHRSTARASRRSGATATTPRSHPPLHPQTCRTSLLARPDRRWAQAPTYNALNFVVTESEIINHAPVLRRFIQAVARGYGAARSDPAAATASLLSARPGLNYGEQLAGVRASLANFFPPVTTSGTAGHPWGWQTVSDWNAFGVWLHDHHFITDPNAVADADTNELLAGQGV